MKKRLLTTPEMIFLISTRAALAAGIALLVSQRLNRSARRAAGMALLGIGGITTIPAARILLRRPSLRERLRVAG